MPPSIREAPKALFLQNSAQTLSCWLLTMRVSAPRGRSPRDLLCSLSRSPSPPFSDHSVRRELLTFGCPGLCTAVARWLTAGLVARLEVAVCLCVCEGAQPCPETPGSLTWASDLSSWHISPARGHVPPQSSLRPPGLTRRSSRPLSHGETLAGTRRGRVQMNRHGCTGSGGRTLRVHSSC